MATTSVLKADTIPDIYDLLQCPVCYEIPPSQIFQCNEGHHVCDRCKARLNLCPVCRSLFFGTRNFALEELIVHIKNLKLNSKTPVESGSGGSEGTISAENSVAGGVPEASVNSEQQSEAVQAPRSCKGLFRCLCCVGQSERLPMGRLLNHLRYYHASDLIEGRSEDGEYVQAWQISTAPRRIVTAVRVADMGIFYLVIEISRENIFGWVLMAAAPWVASDFYYSITISGSDREAVFSDTVWSVKSCEGALKKRSRCLIVSGEDVRALTASQVVNGRLTIKRLPDGEILPAEPRAVLRVANRGAGDNRDAHEGAVQETVPITLRQLLNETLNNVDIIPRAQPDVNRSPNGPVPPPTEYRPAQAQNARAITAQANLRSAAASQPPPVQASINRPAPASALNRQVSTPASVHRPAPSLANTSRPVVASTGLQAAPPVTHSIGFIQVVPYEVNQPPSHHGEPSQPTQPAQQGLLRNKRRRRQRR